MRWLLEMVHAAAPPAHGAAIVSRLHAFLRHREAPALRHVAVRVVRKTCAPLAAMLRRWVVEGVIDDPCGEFFVASGRKVSPHHMWGRKFEIVESLLPAFLDRRTARSILLAGKTVSFIRRVCDESDWFPSLTPPPREAEAAAGSLLEDDSVILNTAYVDETLVLASEKLKDILFQAFHLKSHLLALKQYMLLGKGEFIHELMDSLGSQLDKSAEFLIRNNLIEVLESALRASSSSGFDKEVVERLDLQAFGVSHGEMGWDVFSLVYRISDVQLSPVFTKDSMDSYANIFHFLFKIKRVEHGLARSWLVQRSKELRRKELRPMVSRLESLRMNMFHLIQNLQYYIMFDVLETAWKELVESVDKGKDLDDIISAHRDYLRLILDRVFLSDASRSIGSRLRVVLDTILTFIAISAKAKVLVDEAELSNGFEEPLWFEKEAEITKEINECRMDYDAKLKEFLMDLVTLGKEWKEKTSNGSPGGQEKLLSLAFRLDFNEFYALPIS